jgi:hypothetical protein
VRRQILLVYALIFSSELLQSAIVPLLPTFAADFAISKTETGALSLARRLVEHTVRSIVCSRRPPPVYMIAELESGFELRWEVSRE